MILRCTFNFSWMHFCSIACIFIHMIIMGMDSKYQSSYLQLPSMILHQHIPPNLSYHCIFTIYFFLSHYLDLLLFLVASLLPLSNKVTQFHILDILFVVFHYSHKRSMIYLSFLFSTALIIALLTLPFSFHLPQLPIFLSWLHENRSIIFINHSITLLPRLIRKDDF